MMIMRLLASAAVGLLALGGCTKNAPPPKTGTPPATEQPDASAGEPTANTPPRATEGPLIRMLGEATRIVAASGPTAAKKWSKDLSESEATTLRAGIGNPALNDAVPKCPPSVLVTFYKGTQVIGTMGAFCSAQSNVIRVDIGGSAKAFTPADPSKVRAALADPTDV